MLALLFLLRTAAAQDAQDCDLLAAELPDPGAAATLAAAVGFGAGHVYAKRPAGLLFAVPEIVGIGMMAAGMSKAAKASEDVISPQDADYVQKEEDRLDDQKAASTLVGAGVGIVLGARLVEVPSAVAAAHSHRREMANECRSAASVLPAGYGLLGATPSNRPVPEVPAEIRKDVVLLTSTEIMKIAGLSTLDPQMEGVKAWVTELLRGGASPSEIIGKAKKGEAPVQPASLPTKSPTPPAEP